MSDSPVRVRRAVPEDGPRLIQLDRELAQFENLQPPDDAEAARLLTWIFESKKLEALVAEVDGEIQAIALFYEALGSSFRARPFLYLEDLLVTEAARSRRVGESCHTWPLPDAQALLTLGRRLRQWPASAQETATACGWA